MTEPTTRKPYTVAAMRHSGTHLITPLVRYLTGRTVYSPKGEVSLTCQPSQTVVVWLRNPRNYLVSAYKFKRRLRVAPDSPAAVDEDLASFIPPYLDFARRWAERWVDWPNALTCRFEHFADPLDRSIAIGQVARLKEFLGQTIAEAVTVYDRVYAKSGTYTGQHSWWPKWFGEKTSSRFARLGGSELSVMMGYHP